MTRNDLTVAMLALADGDAYQPVQIQKAMFLLTDKLPHLVDEGPGYKFRAYDYGPFDDDVYRVAEDEARKGLVEINSAGRWKTYAASKDGVARGQEVLSRLSPSDRERLKKISELVRRLSFTELVRAIYKAYPEMKANSVFSG